MRSEIQSSSSEVSSAVTGYGSMIMATGIRVPIVRSSMSIKLVVRSFVRLSLGLYERLDDLRGFEAR